jgi:hypothetical protein
MDDFQLWNNKDERLADALARAYQHQMGARTIHRLIQLWGVAGNDFLLETEISIAADTLTPTKEKPRLMTITFIPDNYKPTKPPEPKPREEAGWGFGFFNTQPESEPVETELPEAKPYHLRLRKEAIIRWFKERLLTKMEDIYDDADEDIDYLAPNPNWGDEDEAAVMLSLAKGKFYPSQSP